MCAPMPVDHSAALSVLRWLAIMWMLACGRGGAEVQRDAGLERALHSVVAREYFVSPGSMGLQAPNRAQAFRTHFAVDGIRLVGRDDVARPLAQLQLLSVGRAEHLESIGPAASLVSDGPVATLLWPALRVEYRNAPAGLEQSCVVETPRAGAGPLTLTWSMDGAVAVSDDGEPGWIASGSVLRLSPWTAMDAAGRVLPLTLAQTTDGTMRAAVDDRAARYPITVKTILTGGRDALLQPDQANAQFGTSVSAAGDVNGDGLADLIVGAPGFDGGEVDEGAAFIFLGVLGGISVEADAVLESNQPGAGLGAAVAGGADANGDGYDDVIVGATRYSNGQPLEGGAFVYFGGPGTFDLTADAQLESDQSNADFGNSVALVGDMDGDGNSEIAVGAGRYDAGQLDEGAVFVYRGGPGGWGTAVRFEADQAGAAFGFRLDAAGDLNGDGLADLVVAAPTYDNGENNEGAIFAFLGSTDIDTLADTVIDSDQASSGFGRSIAGAGDINGDGYADVVVGAPDFDNGQPEEGAALIYLGGSAGLNGVAHALLDDNADGDRLGTAVDGAGDVNGDGYADLIIGVPHRLTPYPELNDGSAFVYFGGPGAFDRTVDGLLDSDRIIGDYGTRVAGVGDIDGDGFADVAVSAPLLTSGHSLEGLVYVFRGGAGPRMLTPRSLVESQQTDARFGASVAWAGDLNGDGFGDVAVGAPQFDNGQVDEGAVIVYFGQANGRLNPSNSIQIESNQANAQFGTSIAGAGDLNADGYADLLVGAPFFNGGQVEEGAVFVYLGGPTLGTSADIRFESNQAGARLGLALAGVGDVNGDGYADLAASAPWYDGPSTDNGIVFVHFGGPALDAAPDGFLESTIPFARIGGSVSAAGDVNADGFADLIVGASGFPLPPTDKGVTLVYFGAAGATFNDTADAQLSSGQGVAQFGIAVSGGGDFNADGIADVVVGADRFTNGQPDEGAVFIYYGGAGSFDTVADLRLESNRAGLQMGGSVAQVGDVTGDGRADVAIGASRFINGQEDEGAVFVYSGSTLFAIIESNLVNARFGSSVAGAGDIDGDGFADLVVGAPFYSNPMEREGGAFIHSISSGRQVRARQLRVDGSSLQPGATVDTFMVSLTATSPRGSERGRLQVELCPATSPFGAESCVLRQQPGWVDLGAPGSSTSLALTLGGQASAQATRWRARVQYAPLHGAQPVSAIAGPWRRHQANAGQTDLRLLAGDRIFATGFE